MSMLNFKGKAFTQNHHLIVKYHQLVPKLEGRMNPNPNKPFRPPKDELKKRAPEIDQERVKRVGFREIVRRLLGVRDSKG